MIKKWKLALALIFGILLTACTPTGVNDLDTITTPADGLPPRAALEAQRMLSETLGVSVEEIAIEDIEQVEWPNACLGLENQNEMCAEVITPGFRVVLEYQGQQYEFRADQVGDIVRRAQ